MLKLNQVRIRPGHSEAELRKKAADLLRIPVQDIVYIKMIRRSIDARRKPEIFFSYTLELDVKQEDKVLRRCRGKEVQVSKADKISYCFPEQGRRIGKHPIVIVGMGPEGLFCGYFLALHGYKPILLERGKCVEDRQRDVELFWESGRLNPISNVQFGEGGAGAFSDGKLNTLVKDKDGRNGVILETLVKFGAEENICYEAKPHIGTDVLCNVVRRMREEIIRLGGQVRFESQVTEVCISKGRVEGVVIGGRERLACEQLVLAIGHSARDTFSMLYEKQVPMEAKAFAVGLRVEHPQVMINQSQYACAEPGELGAAPYKVTAKAQNGRGVYSFCMCPGGYVVNASSEEGRTAVNGMSYSGRNGSNANSAVVVTVTPEDFGSEHPLAGIAFQRRLEEKAYAIGKGKIPVQRYGEYRECVRRNTGSIIEDKNVQQEADSIQMGSEESTVPEADSRVSVSQAGAVRKVNSMEGNPKTENREGKQDKIMPQCKGMYVWADVSQILPAECNRAIVDGMEAFGKQIRGFERPDVCVSGVESRTSSPVRILRDDSLQSSIRGLYPCGEGAGYAGGILSAAMDGLRVAEAIAADKNEN